MAENQHRVMRSVGVDFEHGKIQPQAIDFEEAVLGAIMLEPAACSRAMELIKTGDAFYKDQNKTVFNAIHALYSKNNPVDVLTVTQQCKIDGTLEAAGGGYYITQLTNKVSSSANMEFHIAIIQQKWMRRAMIHSGSEMIRESFEDTDDVFECMDKTIMGLMEIYNSVNSTSAESVGDIATHNYEIIVNMDKSKLIGISSGFQKVDTITNGWQDGDLIIIAGRPGMGKTAFGVSMIYNMAVKNGVPVGFISLEMTKSQVVMRLQSIMANTPYQDLRGGQLTDVQKIQVAKDVEILMDVSAHIDDSPSLTIVQLRAKVMDMVRHHGIRLVMIDYLQLMSGVGKRGQNREQEVSDISRGLKALAKELSIPIIAFSQLSRKVEDRGGEKRPKLSDLRESGAIEQDSDLVIFLYRPEYYGVKEDDLGNSFENVGIVMIEKHRNGSTGEFRLEFKKNTMQYKNFDVGMKEMPEGSDGVIDFFSEKKETDETPF